MSDEYLEIQMTIPEAQRLLRLLYKHLDPANNDLVLEIEAALDDASIEDDPSIDE